ncbi:MAG: ClbS/DfsB family four-helix bundle protein [Cohaesibacter sp.]|nr:ClbS/DfsB family four-helix bundle protein [Cohaesibacter sp.]MCV6603514.1 ClbS/DfsB family four-helix bundle protein [Cohaesibacter sp.]
MPAKNKIDLIAVTETEFAKLDLLLDSICDAQALYLEPDDQQSIKDTIAHRAHWLDLFFVWYEAGLAGEDIQTPAPGYKWNQLKAYNAGVIEASRSQSWQDILADFRAGHDKLLSFLQASDDQMLYTAKLYPWMRNWTLGRWAEANGASHYRSASKYIKKVLKHQAQPS